MLRVEIAETETRDVITAELDASRAVTLYHGAAIAGRGRWEGQIVGCDAQLGEDAIESGAIREAINGAMAGELAEQERLGIMTEWADAAA